MGTTSCMKSHLGVEDPISQSLQRTQLKHLPHQLPDKLLLFALA